MLLRKIFSVLLFVTVFVLPLILQYLANGIVFSGNTFVEERAFIQGISDLSQHFLENFNNYILVFVNPLFIFFIVAFLVQELIKWTISHD